MATAYGCFPFLVDGQAPPKGDVGCSGFPSGRNLLIAVDCAHHSRTASNVTRLLDAHDAVERVGSQATDES